MLKMPSALSGPLLYRYTYIYQCATREKPPPCQKTENWSCELKPCRFNGEEKVSIECGIRVDVVLKTRLEIFENSSKIVPKMIPNS